MAPLDSAILLNLIFIIMKKSILASLAIASVAGSAMAWTPVSQAPASASLADGLTVAGSVGMRNLPKAPARENEQSDTYQVGPAVNPANPANCYSFNTGSASYLFMAVQIDPEIVAALEGDEITGLNITTGTNNSTGTTQGLSTVSAFILRDLKGPYAARKSVALAKEGRTVNSFDFDEPYTISGSEPLYIGYSFKIASSNGYYGAVDEVPIASGGALLGGATKATNMPTSWTDFSSEIGSFCITASVRGSHAPYDQAQIISSVIPETAVIGEPLKYTIQVYNRGQNEISSMDIATSLTGDLNYVNHFDLDKAVPVGGITKLEVEVPALEKPAIYNLVSKIAKVNDVDNVYPGQSAGTVMCFTEGYPRRVVIEEATGTWCGWCPAGAYLLENLREKYPEDVVRIAVHSGDRMEIAAYSGFINDYISGFPCAIIDRANEIWPTTSNVLNEVCSYVDQQIASPSYVNVEVSGEESEDGKSVKATANVKFAVDAEARHLLSFVVVEDQVGPYSQTNYFAAGQQGHSMPMGEWNDRPASYSMLFDDVARNLHSYPGISDAIPATVVGGETYTYSLDMSVQNVKNSEYRLIALLTNGNDGKIINAGQVTVKHNTGVSAVAADAAPVVKVVEGAIVVENAAEVAIYGIDGAKVSDRATTAVPAGIYVVVADGKATKVAVK